MGRGGLRGRGWALQQCMAAFRHAVAERAAATAVSCGVGGTARDGGRLACKRFTSCQNPVHGDVRAVHDARRADVGCCCLHTAGRAHAMVTACVEAAGGTVFFVDSHLRAACQRGQVQQSSYGSLSLPGCCGNALWGYCLTGIVAIRATTPQSSGLRCMLMHSWNSNHYFAGRSRFLGGVPCTAPCRRDLTTCLKVAPCAPSPLRTARRPRVEHNVGRGG